MKMKEIVTRMMIAKETLFAGKIIVVPNSLGDGQTVVWKVSYLPLYGNSAENDTK